MKDLRKRGFLVLRTAGSHGPFDLIAIYPGERPELIQLKGTNGSDATVDRMGSKFTDHPPLPHSEKYSQVIMIFQKGKWHSNYYVIAGRK